MKKTFETSESAFLSNLPDKLEHEFMQYITRHPAVQEGRACIKGTEITVKSIITQLHEGHTSDEIIEENTNLTVDMVEACKDFDNIGNYYNPSLWDKYPIDVAIKFMENESIAVAISHKNEKITPRPWQVIRLFNDVKTAEVFCEMMLPSNKYSWSHYINAPYLTNWGLQCHLIAKNPYRIGNYTMDDGYRGMRMWKIRETAINKGHDSFIITNTEWSDCDKEATGNLATVFGVFNLYQIIEAQDGWQMDDPENSHRNGAGLYLFADRKILDEN